MRRGPIVNEPRPFFRTGWPAHARLTLCVALSVLLMLGDVRWGMTQPLRSVLSILLYPVQVLTLVPIELARTASEYVQSKNRVQHEATVARETALVQSAKALQVDLLLLENQRLRALLEMRERRGLDAHGAQVLYEAADPYSRKLILDRGTLQGMQPGAAVMDENGIVGQITRTYPTVSELTLITDRDQAIPVLNVRNGLRGVAYGDSEGSDLIELRYMATNADIQEGDFLTTSGIDGVFPPGLPVAKVVRIERKSETVFARILCQPVALTQGVRQVMVITPTGEHAPERPLTPSTKTGGRR